MPKDQKIEELAERFRRLTEAPEGLAAIARFAGMMYPNLLYPDSRETVHERPPQLQRVK